MSIVLTVHSTVSSLHQALDFEMNPPSCSVEYLPYGIATVTVESLEGNSIERAYVSEVKDSAQ
jgi:hypothetical protein